LALAARQGENGGFARLRALGTARAELSASGVSRSGRIEMAKFEALAFTFGFIAAGLLTIAGQVQLV
jgi:hypothetical protein